MMSARLFQIKHRQHLLGTFSLLSFTGNETLCQYLVAMFNVEPVGGVSKARSVVEIPQVAPQIGIVHNTFLVALNKKAVGTSVITDGHTR